MKALLATLALTLSSLSFGEQANLPVNCGEIDEYNKIIEEAGDAVGFVGQGENDDGGRIYTVITHNEDFGTWMAAIINPLENVVCIVGFGHKHSFDQE